MSVIFKPGVILILLYDFQKNKYFLESLLFCCHFLIFLHCRESVRSAYLAITLWVFKFMHSTAYYIYHHYLIFVFLILFSKCIFLVWVYLIHFLLLFRTYDYTIIDLFILSLVDIFINFFLCLSFPPHPQWKTLLH